MADAWKVAHVTMAMSKADLLRIANEVPREFRVNTGVSGRPTKSELIEFIRASRAKFYDAPNHPKRPARPSRPTPPEAFSRYRSDEQTASATVDPRDVFPGRPRLKTRAGRAVTADLCEIPAEKVNTWLRTLPPVEPE